MDARTEEASGTLPRPQEIIADSFNLNEENITEAVENETITVSAVKYSNAVGKKLQIDEDGKLYSKTPPRPPRGTASVKTFQDLKAYWAWRIKQGVKVCLFAGNFDPEQDGAPVGYKSADDETIAASKDYLGFAPGGAVMHIDIDTKSDDEVEALWRGDGAATYENHASLVAMLRRVYPFLEGVALGVIDSSSAMVFDEDGNQLSGRSGFRVDVGVDDGSMIPEILQIMHDMCWAEGDGNWAFVSKGGSIQYRSIVDLALTRPTQPDFAAPSCAKGVISRRENAFFDGGMLRATSVLPLDDTQRVAMKDHQYDAWDFLTKKSDKVISARRVRLTRKMTKANPECKSPEKMVERMFEGVLYGDLPISIGDDEVTADQLARDGGDYDEALCLDPVEPNYRGQQPMGKFYWNGGNNPQINSYAHGEHPYSIRIDAKGITAEMKAAKEAKAAVDSDYVVRLLALMEGSGSDCKAATKAAAMALGLGNATKDLTGDMHSFRATHHIKNIKRRSSQKHPGGEFEFGDDVDACPLDAPITSAMWPITDEDAKPVAHPDNYAYMFARYGLSMSWNQITKDLDWEFSNNAMSAGTDNAAERLKVVVLGMCALNGIAKQDIGSQIIANADQHQYNPVTEYLRTLEWDGEERINTLAGLCGASNQEVAGIAWDIFFLSACAAADAGRLGCSLNPDAHPSFEYVLVLSGEQGINKTKGMRRLLPEKLREYFKEAIVLDIKNKDTRKEATACWIGELGELDATFARSAISELKGFISQQVDEIRLPYAASWGRFARRTVYYATVNELEFLRDETGNRRFMPLAVDGVPALDEVTIDQMWAEAWHAYSTGEQWWPSAADDILLAKSVREFEEASPMKEELLDNYGWTDSDCRMHPSRLSASEIYRDTAIDFKIPSRTDLNSLRKAIRSLWKEHAEVTKTGQIKVKVPNGHGGFDVSPTLHSIKNSGGKNVGWLVPSTLTQKLARLREVQQAKEAQVKGG